MPDSGIPGGTVCRCALWRGFPFLSAHAENGLAVAWAKVGPGGLQMNASVPSSRTVVGWAVVLVCALLVARILVPF